MGRPKGANKLWQGLMFNGCEILQPVIIGKTGSMDKWYIKCYCGKIFERWPTELRREKNASCGCNSSRILKELHKRLKIDYRNYHHLESGIIILEPIDLNYDGGQDQWSMLCPYHDVPVLFNARPTSIRTGHTKSCGCLQKEGVKKNKMLRQYHEQKRIDRGLDKNQYIVSESILIRDALFEPIRHLVFQRDQYQCRRCCKKHEYLNAHHIVPLNEMSFDNSESLALSYNLSNIITLCRGCHLEAHNFDWQDINISLQTWYLRLVKDAPEKILEEYNLIVFRQIEPWLENYLEKQNARKVTILV